jgi:hypothetical protein
MLAMRLEENEFLREALETRVAEAERVAEQALASKQSSVSDQLDRLREEVDRNAYLRRLLKKAEQRRGEARARASAKPAPSLRRCRVRRTATRRRSRRGWTGTRRRAAACVGA